MNCSYLDTSKGAAYSLCESSNTMACGVRLALGLKMDPLERDVQNH